MNPELDRDGYPTQDTLDRIAFWPYEDHEGLMRFVAEAWAYPDYCTTNGTGHWTLCTAGWSGNEEIISAMKKNHVFWGLRWQSSHRGGKYEFEVQNNK